MLSALLLFLFAFLMGGFTVIAVQVALVYYYLSEMQERRLDHLTRTAMSKADATPNDTGAEAELTRKAGLEVPPLPSRNQSSSSEFMVVHSVLLGLDDGGIHESDE